MLLLLLGMALLASCGEEEYSLGRVSPPVRINWGPHPGAVYDVGSGEQKDLRLIFGTPIRVGSFDPAGVTVEPPIPFTLRFYRDGRESTAEADAVVIDLDEAALSVGAMHRVVLRQTLQPVGGLAFKLREVSLLRVARTQAPELALEHVEPASLQSQVERLLVPGADRRWVAPHGDVSLTFNKPVASVGWRLDTAGEPAERRGGGALDRVARPDRQVGFQLPQGLAANEALTLTLASRAPALDDGVPTQAVDGGFLPPGVTRRLRTSWASLEAQPRPSDPHDATSSLAMGFQVADLRTEVRATLHRYGSPAPIMALETTLEAAGAGRRFPVDMGAGLEGIDESSGRPARRGTVVIPRSALAEGKYHVVLWAYEASVEPIAYRGLDLRPIEIDRRAPRIVGAAGAASAASSPGVLAAKGGAPTTSGSNYLRLAAGLPSLVERVCVAVDEPIRALHLLCGSTPVGVATLIPAGTPASKSGVAVACASRVRLDAPCASATQWHAQAEDAAGNLSPPALLRNATCETPSKFVSYAGRRTALKVDDNGTTHLVYTTEDGVYYTWWDQSAGSWQRRPLHCLCTNGVDDQPPPAQCPAYDPKTCTKRYGHNVGLGVSDGGMPGVCFVVSDRGSEFETQGSLIVAIAESDPRGAAPSWRRRVFSDARPFHCALVNPRDVAEGDASGIEVVYVEARPGSGEQAEANDRLISRRFLGGQSWSAPAEVVPWLGRDVAIAQERHGARRIHLAFRDGDRGLHYAQKMPGQPWATRAILGLGGESLRGMRPSIALDTGGRAAISYHSFDDNLPYIALRRLPAARLPSRDLWEAEPILADTDPWRGYPVGMSTELTTWPGKIGSAPNIYEGSPTSLVLTNRWLKVAFVSGMRMRADGGRPKVFGLGELVLASRELARGRWRYSTLDGRVEGEGHVSYDVTPDGVGRIAYHNGLTPAPTITDQRYGSLNYWHGESRRGFFMDELDDPGANCASVTYVHHGGVHAVSDDHVNLKLAPVQLTSSSNGELVQTTATELFERIRRYENVDGLLGAPAVGWDHADTHDLAVQGAILAQLASPSDTTGLLSLLLEMSRLYTHVATEGNTMAARLTGGSKPKTSIAGYSYDPDQHRLGGPLIPAVVNGLKIRSSLDSPLVRPQLNVCVPDSCDKLQAQIVPSLPATPYADAALVWAVSLGATSLQQVATSCRAQANPAVLVGTPGGPFTHVREGCYACLPGEVVVGVPGDPRPKCQPVGTGPGACPAAESPSYRYLESDTAHAAPYFHCSDSGCDDTRCSSAKCAPTEFTPRDAGGAGASVSADEHPLSVPHRAECTRCPEGYRRTRCSQQPGNCDDAAHPALNRPCKTDADCGYPIEGMQCAYGTCRRRKTIGRLTRQCSSDAECDYYNGQRCAGGRCGKYPSCTTRRECQLLMHWDAATCENGACLSACSTTFHCSVGTCMHLSLPRACAEGDMGWDCRCVLEPFEEKREAYFCQAVGCTECVGNAFCVPRSEDQEPPWNFERTSFSSCPKSHHCEVHTATDTPTCVARPLFGDYLWRRFKRFSTVPLGGLEDFLKIEASIDDALHSISAAEAFDKVSFSWRIADGSLKLLPSHFGPGHQGRIALSIAFEQPFTLEMDVGSGCSAEAYTVLPPVVRIEAEPYTFGPTGDVYFRATNGGVYSDQYRYDLPNIQPNGCLATLGYSCGIVTRDQVNQDLEAQVVDQVTGNSLLGAGETIFNTIIKLVMRNMLVGGWLLGREATLDDLDIARDVVPGPSRQYRGDNNPQDETLQFFIKNGEGVSLLRER